MRAGHVAWRSRSFLVVLVAWGAGGAPAAGPVFRFDCGPPRSPVMAGYQRLSASDTYDPAKGYGWVDSDPKDIVFGRLRELDLQAAARGETPIAAPGGRRAGRGPSGWMEEHVRQYRDDRNRDAVISREDLKFRLDLPDGTYRVTLTIGDLEVAIGSIVVKLNGRTIAERVAAWAPGGYRQLQRTPMGWWTRVRGTAEVQGGPLEILLTRDDRYFREKMAEQAALPNPQSIHWRPDWDRREPPYDYIGYPFVRHSVMAIEVTPLAPPPVTREEGRLQTTIPSPALAEAIQQFNAGKMAEAAAALDDVTEPEAQAARAIVQLWIAGSLRSEQEVQLTPRAIATLEAWMADHPSDYGVAEILEDAKIFQRGLTTHRDRGRMRWVDGKPVQRNHFVENDKAMGWFWMIREGSPLYDKAQLYMAIASHQLTPYIPAIGMPRQIFEALEKKDAANRFVRYYLHWEWEPHGDGTGRNDWYMVDYYGQTEGSPEWARRLQHSYATMIDWAEYWVRFRQYPEGNIGGGWGDDVEIVGAFGYLGHLSRGVSDLCIQGTRNLVEGMWNLSEVDPEIGYCLPMADAEHTAEWTGNTLGMMVQIDYGNPVWIERSLKTGKLMRDLWTAYDDRGYRHFRANFFGAAQVGNGDQQNDAFINLRAVRPALAVLAYNQNPALSKLFVELADAWLADALRTDRGKPRGVIPAQVSFPDGILGGTNSPNWWTASHPPGTVNYDWWNRTGRGQNYKDYIQGLFITAYMQTGDAKYLDPLRLEYELAEKYGYAVPLRGQERLGPAPWIAHGPDTRDGFDVLIERWTPPRRRTPSPSDRTARRRAPEQPPPDASHRPGSEAWVASQLKGVERWFQAERLLQGRSEGLANDITREQIVDHLSYADAHLRMVWPLATTQASATDRIPVASTLLPVLFTYTGGRLGGALLRTPITYVDTTKWFAAAVMAADRQGFRILYHSMTPAERRVGIVPWELEPNGRYTLTYGPDADEDEQMDHVTERRDFLWPQTGTPIYITVKPKTTYVVELEQTQRGRVAGTAPDPAISPVDIRYVPDRGLLLARVHNVGSQRVVNLEVAFYDGHPQQGGPLIGRTRAPNIEPPNDLEPRWLTVGVNWRPDSGKHDVYVVLDPNGSIQNEITEFNNVAHAEIGMGPGPGNDR